LSQLKEYHPSENFEFNILGISQSLKLRILMEIILLISLKLNFSPNTVGYYGLMSGISSNISEVNAKITVEFNTVLLFK